MAVVTEAEIQAWLEATKYTATLDADLEATAREGVFSKLTAAHYDTSTWTNNATTPELVRRVIAMLVAAWEYDRATAEDQLEGSSYADKLERRAWSLLQAIVDGEMEIPGVEPDDALSADGSILFFPTDAESEHTRAPGSLDTDSEYGRMFEVGMNF